MDIESMHMELEALEPRELLSGTPLDVEATDEGLLVVEGTRYDDKITVEQTKAGLVISNRGGWSQTFLGSYESLVVNGKKGNDRILIDSSVKIDAVLHGNGGRDTLTGGRGNDRLFGDGGADTLKGGRGDDVLVSLGDVRKDRLIGGAGRDSFWADDHANEKVVNASAKELAAGAVHRISKFANYQYFTDGMAKSTSVPTKLAGQDLLDPEVSSSGITYVDFSDHPLFSAEGPLADDIAQGWVGDCYFLATLSSVASLNADLIEESVVELGDGTYAVRYFADTGAETYYRVDGDLPTWSSGDLTYAKAGADDSIWVAIMEKAYAFHRYNEATYASLDSGWMSEVYTALGLESTDYFDDTADEATLLSHIESELDAGRSVTFAVYDAPPGAPVVSQHAYSVISVNEDADGNKTLTLRNPWGFDGKGSDGADDGYVTLTAAQARAAYWGVISADV